MVLPRNSMMVMVRDTRVIVGERRIMMYIIAERLFFSQTPSTEFCEHECC